MISLQKSDWFTIELSREIIAKSLLRRIQLYQSNNNYNVAIIIEWTNHCIPIKPSSSTYCFDFNTLLLPRFLGWFAAMDDSSDVFIMIGDDDFSSDVSWTKRTLSNQSVLKFPLVILVTLTRLWVLTVVLSFKYFFVNLLIPRPLHHLLPPKKNYAKVLLTPLCFRCQSPS